MGIRNAEGYMDLVPYQAIANVNREMKAETKIGFRPLVYICAPFSGDIEANKKKATAFAEHAYQNGCIPVTPHLLFPFMNDESKQVRVYIIIACSPNIFNSFAKIHHIMPRIFHIMKAGNQSY